MARGRNRRKDSRPPKSERSEKDRAADEVRRLKGVVEVRRKKLDRAELALHDAEKREKQTGKSKPAAKETA